MSGIVSGLSSEDRNTIGIYPLKGKLLNVRGAQIKNISENKEITDIKKILGLENGREYATIEDVHRQLRYGKIMILCDQDVDGSHIKGLCINLMHSEWASLVKIPGFISFMNTPILRARKGQQTVLFYNEGEYNTWKSAQPTLSGWNIKYFKGLGTSTSVEFKEYFANKKIVDFNYTGETSDNTIDKVFNKKRADDRKTWLENYDKHAFLDTSRPSVQYEEFIDRELIHFSTYDCARSIPNMVDGLKTSLRKILFCAFKRRLTTEIKVAQFSGYVSEHSAYHHGEASLNGAIVNMAQNFVGSNNIHLLEPKGQFGTRLQGGDDSASERYIFTHLSPLTRVLFPEADDATLTFLDDDGTPVEPEYYIPILPFALVNGISGIGTGFSCNIQPYHPLDLVHYLKNRLLGYGAYPAPNFTPYYEGFKGSVCKIAEQKYLISGVYEKLSDDKIRISELPVGTWTMPYITFLEGLMDGTTNEKTGKKTSPSIKDFTSVSTEVNVDIIIQFPKGDLSKLEDTVDLNGVNGIQKLLKLSTTVSTTNMHMFNAERKLHKYATVEEIIDAFYEVRMKGYIERKANLVKEKEDTLKKLSNRAKYILENLDGTIDLRRKTAREVSELLTSHHYELVNGEYTYLTKMPMDSVTQENVDAILKDKSVCETELDILKKTTEAQMWIDELTAFETVYSKYQKERSQLQQPGVAETPKKKPEAKKRPVKIQSKPL